MTFRPSRSLSLFFVVACALLFWNLHRIPLFDPDEGRYADISLEMLKTGDWVTPRMNYVAHLHKPPLSSWLVALSFKFLGPSEFSARLPGVLLSLLLLAFSIQLGKYLFDFETGLYGAWILLTSVLYFATSRLVTTDMTLVFLTFVTMASAAHLFFGTSRPVFFFYTMILSMALGMLTKGPVAWLITVLPQVIFSVWTRRKFSIPRRHGWMGGILFIVISFSWYFLITIQNAGSFHYFIHDQLLGRIFKGTMGRKHPLYYFLIVLPLGFLPWTVFVPSAVEALLVNRDSSRELRERFLYLLLWFLIPFILFSVIRTKLATYIVPVFPPLALFSGYFWRQLDAARIPATRLLRASSWILAVVPAAAVTVGLIFIAFRPEFVRGIPAVFFFIVGISLFLFSILEIRVLLKQRLNQFFRLEIGLLCFLILLVCHVLPEIQYKNSKVFAEKILELKKPGDSVVMFKRYFASLPFYLGERVIEVGTLQEVSFESAKNVADHIFPSENSLQVFLQGPNRIFVVAPKDEFEKIKSQNPIPVYSLLEQQKAVLFSNRKI